MDSFERFEVVELDRDKLARRDVSIMSQRKFAGFTYRFSVITILSDTVIFSN